MNKHVDDSWKQIPKDNVYIGRYYRWPVYTVAEAIQCHRETHHPSMYNVPNAPLNVDIELNMQGEKATRFVDNFQRMAMIPYRFDHGEERKILVFTKGNVCLWNFMFYYELFYCYFFFNRMRWLRLELPVLHLLVVWNLLRI